MHFFDRVNSTLLVFDNVGFISEVFELEIEKGYNPQSFIEDYKKLIAYLEIKYDSTHKFFPFDLLRVTAKRRNVEEDLKKSNDIISM